MKREVGRGIKSNARNCSWEGARRPPPAPELTALLWSSLPRGTVLSPPALPPEPPPKRCLMCPCARLRTASAHARPGPERVKRRRGGKGTVSHIMCVCVCVCGGGGWGGVVCVWGGGIAQQIDCESDFGAYHNKHDSASTATRDQELLATEK